MKEKNRLILVDYNQSLSEMFSKTPCYWHHENLNSKKFPVPERLIGQKIEVLTKTFCCLESEITFDNVLKRMTENGYRPANIFELLVFSYTHPRVQTKHYIFALGSSSILRKKKVVPCISKMDGIDIVTLYSDTLTCQSSFIFLAVKI